MPSVLKPQDSVRISAFLGHKQEDVVRSLVKDGMEADQAHRLVAREYAERARIDAEDEKLDGD
jgi:hypothetical protein